MHACLTMFSPADDLRQADPGMHTAADCSTSMMGRSGVCFCHSHPCALMARVLLVSIASHTPDGNGAGITRKGSHRDILDERTAFHKLVRTRAAAQGQPLKPQDIFLGYSPCAVTFSLQSQAHD